MWHDIEVKALLEVWSGELIQAQLSGAYRNSVPDNFWHAGTTRYPLHGEAVVRQIKSLKKKYKEIVDKLRRSRVGVASDEELEMWYDWKCFEPLHQLMRKCPSVNPVGLLEIRRRLWPATPASIGSDTSGALLDQSVLSGDDGQHVNTTDYGSSTTITASASATTPESSTTSTASASATAPETALQSLQLLWVPLPLKAALQPPVWQVPVFFLLRKGRGSKQKWKKHGEMRMLHLINFWSCRKIPRSHFCRS